MAIKRGSSAIKSALAENSGGGSSVAFTPFKSGTAFKLRIQSIDDIVEYKCASVFKVFNSTAVASNDNLYQRAADLLYKDAKAAKDEAGNKALRDMAYQILPKPKYILGAVDLETGEKVFFDLTKNQAKAVITMLQKKAKKLATSAFELAKTGESTSTAVTLTQLDEDELDAKELAAFEKAAEIDFTDEDFESLVQERSHEEQLEDIYAFDRKLAERLDDSNGGEGSGNTVEADVEDPDDLPF